MEKLTKEELMIVKMMFKEREKELVEIIAKMEQKEERKVDFVFIQKFARAKQELEKVKTIIEKIKGE